MRVFLTSWMIDTLTLYIIVRLFPQVNVQNLIPPQGGVITMDGLLTLLFAAFILGLLNSVLKPLLQLLALPITILTLGLFTIVVTGFVFWLATLIVPGFSVISFGWAMVAGILFGIINWLINSAFGIDEKKK
jgi:putative membrane protein